MPCKLPLIRGGFTQVSPDDYEKFSPYRRGISARGYVRGWVDGKPVYLHRLIAGTPKGKDTDHRDGDKLNNRRSNLRVCTRSQNNANRQKPSRGKYTKYAGVYWSAQNKAWMVRLGSREDQEYIGYFRTPVEAAKAYDFSASRRYGEFAKTNFSKIDPQALSKRIEPRKPKGVYYDKTRDRWCIRLNKKRLGYFKSEVEALVALKEIVGG